MTTRFWQPSPAAGGEAGVSMSLYIHASRVLKNCSSNSTTAVPGGGPPASGARTVSPFGRRAGGAPTKREYAHAPPINRPRTRARTNFIPFDLPPETYGAAVGEALGAAFCCWLTKDITCCSS